MDMETRLRWTHPQLQGRDVELVQLREECKKLIAMHQEQLTVAAETARQLAVKSEEKLHVELERSKLAAELAAMKDSQKSFNIFKAREYERMTAEVCASVTTSLRRLTQSLGGAFAPISEQRQYQCR